ncbi:hypothetical protein Tco_1130356 [Tanacetum coccineum]
MLHELGEVNPTHAYYNDSRTSKDTKDLSWSTSIKTGSHECHLQHWKHFGSPYFVVIILDRNIVKIILISLDSSFNLESTDGPFSSDSGSSNEIVSSNGPLKSLLKWYDDEINEDIKEFLFSKSGGKEGKASGSLSRKVKYASGSSAKKVKYAYWSSASKLKSASGSSTSKLKSYNFKAFGSSFTFKILNPTTGSGAEEEKGKRNVTGGS